MTTYGVDDFAAIAAARRRIRQEEGKPNDDWQTAVGTDLDAVAAGVDLYRKDAESDWAFRQRVEAAVKAKKDLWK